MKNFTFSLKKTTYKYWNICTIAIFFGLSINENIAQKVVIIGVNYSNGTTRNDAVAFVATEILPINTVLYFTDYEYNASTNQFGDSGAGTTTESVIKYTVTTQVPKGTVISLRFSSPMTVGDFVPITKASSNGTDYGTAAFIQTINGVTTNINYRSGGESIYAYADGDDNPVNGISEIYSVFFVGLENGANNLGGNIPGGESPIPDFPNAVVIDGFTFTAAELDLIEFTANRSSNTSKATLENPSNYTTIANAALNPNVTAFANIYPSAVLPILTVSSSASSIVENAAGTITYTFTLNGPAAGNVTVNFTVSGSALFNTDYTQSGAATFNTTTGSIVILNGATSASLTIDPTPDATLEANELVILTAQSVAAVYDAGNPSATTISINNDDADVVQPKIALVGINHGSTGTDIESFSFVALEDIPQNTLFYFTSNSYEKTLLKFINDGAAVIKWTAPVGVNRGDVYVITEDAAGTSFTVTCSAGETSCGTAILQTGGGLSFALDGTNFKAYSDGDTDPFTGAGQIHSDMYTGVGGAPGGVMLTTINPSNIFPNAVIIENFPALSPLRTEYKFAAGERAVSVSRSLFTNTTNWVHAGSLQTVSTIRFANITITNGVTLPQVIVNVAASTVNENSGTAMVYTFTASQNATTDLTVNFSITGLAALATDYTVSGSPVSGFTFGGNGGVGTIKILTGTNISTITLTPVADVILEPNETVILTTNAGVGYEIGSPSVATGTIVNDDKLNAGPLVAIIGVNAGTTAAQNPDGFSFVASQDIPVNTEIYFTTNPFSNTTLAFVPNFYVVKYTSGGLTKGQVVYIVETGPSTNAFTVTCSAGSNCGSVALIAGDFSFPSGGVRFFAYTDEDTNPSNSIIAVHSMFYTYSGIVPAGENPNTVYPNALVLEGFNVATPDRTEYKFASGERSMPVIIANIKNISNYLIGQTTQNLSIIPFTTIDLCPASIATQPTNANVVANANTQFSVMATGTNLTYQWQVNTGSGFVNITNGGVYSGATTSILVLTAVPCSFINYTYRCVINDCAISEAKSLTVNAPVIPITTNNGLKFDGANDYVVANLCDATPIITGGNAITVEYWFKGSNIQSAVRTQDSDNDYMVAGWSFPSLHILSNDGGTNGGIAVGAAATDGNWHHVAFTWEQGAANGFTSYLDGNIVAQRNAANVPLPNINNPLYLGAFQGASEYMNGALDNVRIWNVARNQAQIQAGMCNLSLPQTGLVVFYSFDHGAANGSNAGVNLLENKVSSTNYTGVITNFSLTGSNSNWVQGVIPNTLANGPVTQIQNVTTNPNFTDINCIALGKIDPAGASPVAGNVTMKSWVEPNANYGNVPRHYEINPSVIVPNATANITLYFTQADFDAYNALNSTKLPQNPTDMPGIANIQLIKYSGASSPSNGLPGSYVGGGVDKSVDIITKTWNGQYWEIKFATTGFSGFFIKTASAPLPVNLISFSGKNTENGNLLTWKTANEKGFSHFEVEKSSPLTPDGGIPNGKFEKIGQVDGSQNENYEYLDRPNSPSGGWGAVAGAAYYRLRMVDLDGKYNFSKIIFIENVFEKSTVGNFYPNPSQGKSFIEITSLEKANWSITTFDLTGKQINTETKFLQKGLNKIEIEKLSLGVNFVRFESGLISEIRKIIKE